MAISFVGAGTVASGSNPALTPPAGIAAGDLLIVVSAGTAAGSVNTNLLLSSFGWTRIANQNAGQFISVSAKIATNANENIQLSQSGTTTRAVMLAYRGVGWYDVVAAFNTGTGTSASTLTQTTGFANDFVTSIFAASNVDATWTAPGSTTTRANASATLSLRGLLVVDELQAAAGVTTARTATLSASATWSAVSISIREPRTCFWVGAAGTWDSVTKTNWAISSGGTGGVIVPGYDNVVFDQNSNTGTTAWTVTVPNTDFARCNDFTTSSLDATLTMSTGNTSSFGIVAYGNVTFPATSFSYPSGGNLFLTPVGSKTYTTNGVQVDANLVINSTGTVTLGSTLTIPSLGNNLRLINGTFSTSASNFAVTITGGQFLYDGGTTLSQSATLSMNASTFTISGDNWNVANPAGLTVNRGTSSIVMTGTGPQFIGGGLTYYDLTMTADSFATGINGSNTFRNLTVLVGANKDPVEFTPGTTTTVTGTFTANGTNNITRIRIQLNSGLLTTETARATINAAAVSISNVDFYGIAGTGAASWTGTSIGNLGFNTGITFTTPRSVYFVGATGGSLSSTLPWALTSGGAISSANYPLPQDTIVVDDASSNSGTTITLSSSDEWSPGVDFSLRTTAVTFSVTAISVGLTMIGAMRLSSSVTLSQSGRAITVGGDFSIAAGTVVTGTAFTSFTIIPNLSSTATITTNGNNFFSNLTGTVTLGGNSNSQSIVLSGALTTTRPVVFESVNLNISSGSLTCLSFTSTSTTAKSITFGSNSINVSSINNTLTLTGTGFTYTGTPNFNVNTTGTSTTSVSLATGFTETNAVNLNITAGSYSLGANNIVVRNLNFTGFSGSASTATNRTIFGNLTTSASMTFGGAGLYNFSATSGTQTITTNGLNLNANLVFNGTATYQLIDALTTATMILTSGTFTAGANNVTTGTFSSDNTNVRTLNMGSAQWSLTGTGTVWNTATVTNLTLNRGTANILLSDNTTAARTFNGGAGILYNRLTIGGTTSTSVTTIANSSTFTELASTKTVAHTVRFSAVGAKTIGTWSITGSANGNTVTVDSDTPGTQSLFALTNATSASAINYLVVRDINVTTANRFFLGNSGNLGNNTNVYFEPTSPNLFLMF